MDNSDVKSVMENLTKVLNEDEIKNLVSKIENFEGSLTDSAANKTEILNAIKGAKIKTVSRNNFLNLSNGFWKNRSTIDQAQDIKNTQIAKELSLPPIKLHLPRSSLITCLAPVKILMSSSISALLSQTDHPFQVI